MVYSRVVTQKQSQIVRVRLVCNRPASETAHYVFNVIAENAKSSRVSVKASTSMQLMNLVNRREQRDSVRYFVRVSIQPKDLVTNVRTTNMWPYTLLSRGGACPLTIATDTDVRNVGSHDPGACHHDGELRTQLHPQGPRCGSRAAGRSQHCVVPVVHSLHRCVGLHGSQRTPGKARPWWPRAGVQAPQRLLWSADRCRQ